MRPRATPRRPRGAAPPVRTGPRRVGGRGRGGFSIVAVVFAVALLVTGLLALARSQTYLARTQGSTADRNRAYALARGHMELLRSRPPASLASESAVGIDSLGRPVAGGGYTRTVLVTTEATNLLRVRVQVQYPRGTAPAEIATLIFR